MPSKKHVIGGFLVLESGTRSLQIPAKQRRLDGDVVFVFHGFNFFLISEILFFTDFFLEKRRLLMVKLQTQKCDTELIHHLN